MLVISNHWHDSFIQGKVFVMTHDCACFYFLIDLTVRLFHFFLMYYLLAKLPAFIENEAEKHCMKIQ
jgi:hypothetical protein